MFQQTAAAGSAAAELTSPAVTGQKLAAKIAGPLIDPADRLGPVEFSGPTDAVD